MKSIPFTIKLMILICLLRIPGVMADPTSFLNSILMHYSDTEDESSAKNTTSTVQYTAQANASLTSQNSRFPVNNDRVHYANCHNVEECSFECDSGNAETLFAELTPIYNQHLRCSACGISLTITAGVFFPENRVRSSWRIGNIELSRFEVSLKGITNVETNAFSDQAFRFVDTLVLTDLQITVFDNGAFKGLTSLRSLRLYTLKTYDFAPGFLTGISATLSYLGLNGAGKFRKRYIIDGLTGDIELPRVKLLQIRTNLNGSLSASSFSALTSIRVLFLSDCQIEVISPEIFEPIQLTLQKLYLQRNRIKTIHEDFFDSLFHFQRDLFIYLHGNPWHCDRNIQPYISFLRNFAWRSQGAEPTCASPAHLRDVLVKNADIWTDPQTTDETTSITTVGPPSTVPDLIFPKCPSSWLPSDTDSIPIRSQTLTLALSRNEKGELMVTQTSHISSAITLVWFQSDTQSIFQQNAATLNCLRFISFKTVIQGLVLDTAYTFCLIDQNAILDSPMNCGSYYHRSTGRVGTWLADENQAWVIGGTAFAYMLSLIFGTVLGVLIIRQNPSWINSDFKSVDALDINRLQSKDDIHRKTYISSESNNCLSAQCNAARLSEFRTSDVSNYEMAFHKLDRSHSFYYSGRMPFDDVAPPLPVRMGLEEFVGNQSNYYHNTDILENHYSTLEEAYYNERPL